MPIIIKKGTCPSAFNLGNGRRVLLQVGEGGGDFLNIVSDKDFEDLMHEYGSFIQPRIRSEKNPNGCFIISDKKDYATDFGKEVGKVRDGSSKIEIKEEEPKIEKIEVTSKKKKKK
ncbi:MAG: hypothetical protein J1F17_01750 [Oscillospiraceae bacterium]|nr:hypothetical protein [Oscillospiraceae bacterium]